MSVTINGTSGVTTPGINNSEGYTGDGLTIAAGAPAGAVTVGASGNLGVGTSSPGSKLEVNGNVKFSGSTADLGYGQYPVARLNGNTNNAIFGFALDGAQGGSYNGRDWRIEQGRSGAGQFNITDITAGNVVRLTLDASGNLLFDSGYGSAAKAYGCRAWVNFNGTGTVAIRASGNVSSITDNGTGNYTVNFTTAMPDANYSTALSYSDEAGGGGHAEGWLPYAYNQPSVYTTSQCKVTFHNDTQSGSLVDKVFVNMSFFR